MIGPLKMFLAFTLLKVPGSSSIDHYVSFPFAIGGRFSAITGTYLEVIHNCGGRGCIQSVEAPN